jgi:hypothetical protein
MSFRRVVATALVAALSGCGGAEERREVRLLAPAWIDADIQRFERESGCLVDLRVYDDDEELEPIAERRNVDIVAARAPNGDGDQSEQFVTVTLRGGVEVTVPERLASAYDGRKRPAGRRAIVWMPRRGGGNPECARRWLGYATSQ